MFEALQYVIPEAYDNQNNVITGNFIYFNLDGTFLDAYRKVNDDVEYRLVNVNESSFGFNLSSLFTALIQDCDEDLNPNTDFCSDTLDAVVIGGGGSGGTSAYEHPIWFVYQQNPPESIDAGSSTGSGSVRCPDGQVLGSDGITCHNIPCLDTSTGNGDPLEDMQILGTKNNGIPGGQYGNGRGSFHDGIDLSAPYGTPVFAAHGGVVAAYPYQSDWQSGGNAAGNRLYINTTHDGDNFQLGYWHLGEIIVNRGDHIYQGQLIGYTGNTGNVGNSGSAGPHLHIRARENGQKADPERFFNADFDGQGNNIKNCN